MWVTKTIVVDALGHHDVLKDRDIPWPDIPTASISIVEYSKYKSSELKKNVCSIGVKPELPASSGDAWGG